MTDGITILCRIYKTLETAYCDNPLKSALLLRNQILTFAYRGLRAHRNVMCWLIIGSLGENTVGHNYITASASPCLALLSRRRSIWGRLLATRVLDIPTPPYEGFHLYEKWKGLPARGESSVGAGVHATHPCAQVLGAAEMICHTQHRWHRGVAFDGEGIPCRLHCPSKQ